MSKNLLSKINVKICFIFFWHQNVFPKFLEKNWRRTFFDEKQLKTLLPSKKLKKNWHQIASASRSVSLMKPLGRQCQATRQKFVSSIFFVISASIDVKKFVVKNLCQKLFLSFLTSFFSKICEKKLTSNIFWWNTLKRLLTSKELFTLATQEQKSYCLALRNWNAKMTFVSEEITKTEKTKMQKHRRSTRVS